MKISDRIITTAFHEQGTSAYELAERLGNLANEQFVSARNLLDRASVASADAFQAMLLGYDPRQVASDVFASCQEISLDAYCSTIHKNEQIARQQVGSSAEIAVYGLLWWGVAHKPNFGKYARIANKAEDASGSTGQLNGYDIVFRSMHKRHLIQVKNGFAAVTPGVINRYEKDIFIVSPQYLLGDPDAETNDLHEAIVAEDGDVLQSGLNRFIQILHTQKARNGRRRKI